MSNHTGSYLLNVTLKILAKYGTFEKLGRDNTQLFISELIDIAYFEYDCNPGEILEEIGETLGICYECKQYAESMDNGICNKCNLEKN